MKNFTMAGLALMLAGTGVRAQDGPYISPTMDRVRISLGVMQMSSTTNLRIDSTTGIPGTTVNAEDGFGLDSNKLGPKFQAMIRVAERHRLRFDYFTLERDGSRVLDKPIAFRNTIFRIDDPVNSQLNLRGLGVTYGYSFFHSEKFEAAGTIGVNLLDISARARVQLPTRRVDQREDQAGPVPTVGLDATWVFSKRFYVDGRIQYLKASVDEFDGSLGFYEFSALYRWRANVSFGLGYNMIRAKLTSTKRTEGGFFDFDTKGPELFLRIAF